MDNQQPQRAPDWALQERVKELACLYGIAQISADQDSPVEEVLRQIVELLPPAWQYPEVASARIVLDGLAFTSGGVARGVDSQSAEIRSGGAVRGRVSVAYAEPRPPLDEGPFLKEERHLIDAVAGQIALIVERREARQEKAKLEAQLRHADRLATIGVLAAGVAHELNEPLGNILGFAQLMKKSKHLDAQGQSDLAKIESASLHARQIIRNLLAFARPVLPDRQPMSLNGMIEERVGMFRSRCEQGNVELVTELADGLPPIMGNPVQLSQVFVNLAVNALQAMPRGGRLTVRTAGSPGQVVLAVEDTGVGMSQDILDKIFLPFFTTKDVGRGTGLGLSVVHGIVTAHGGTIRVDSQVGRGSKFEINLPAFQAGSREAPAK